jgi:hypothetical protein
MRAFLLVLAIAVSLPAAAQSTKVHWYGQAAFRIETPRAG